MQVGGVRLGGVQKKAGRPTNNPSRLMPCNSGRNRSVHLAGVPCRTTLRWGQLEENLATEPHPRVPRQSPLRGREFIDRGDSLSAEQRTRSSPPAAMPTPESAMFLAKKPTVPPTFDGVDYDDTKRLKQAQDAIVREQWVQVMMGRLVGEELGKCFRKEGINHLENCGRLRGEQPSVCLIVGNAISLRLSSCSLAF